ncbi:Asp23/Gls24 family envelope stress response protein [Caldalkalibacillus salinus]|uniref:Asp23/Gls24 family envelope stress response protein n=1 Tax=Caldalkalibacillus salinus TaxID=2803787 RepID=UPI001924E582|nr:Asp23/Gls24 family envelope stress response protein [Caldalkalibacillus salinus]
MSEWMENGMIRIADDVVAVISSIATLETEGVSGMSAGIAEGITKRVSGKQVQRGVQVIIEDDEATIDVRVVVQFGQKIDEVCKQVQFNVKKSIENMTGIEVKAVNVRVDGVDLKQQEVKTQTSSAVTPGQALSSFA